MIVTPTIHLNGTSGADLLSQTTDAMLALSAAINALQAAGPNGRDYYPQGPMVLNTALDAHVARIEKLTSVQVELVEMAESIHAQMTERSRT